MTMIEIPPEVYDALSVPEGERQEVLEQELAVALYEKRILSFGKARELSGLSRREFHQLLGDRKVDRSYTSEELDEDIEYARG